jgi:hypothetical protein
MMADVKTNLRRRGAAGTEAKAAAQHRRKGAGARRDSYVFLFSFFKILINSDSRDSASLP